MITKSKKQRMNAHIFNLLIEWVNTIIPEDKDLSLEEIKELLPTEKYTVSLGQVRLSSYTHRWVRKRLKMILKRSHGKRTIESVTMKEIENAKAYT
jgi:hypothetical protein